LKRRRLPLDGILVADFSRVLAGPLCTQLLADTGARVIKIEEPGRGDETRRWGPPFIDGISAYFLSVNRGKESLALDLRNERDAEVAEKLLARADVVVDNFLPPQRAALGIASARERFPRLVHCSISGYDRGTPDANAPGYDLLAQAGAGLMSITGAADGEPMKAGVALADVLTAHHAYGAINAALVARERTGEGASIEISLFSATLASLVNVAQSALVTGREARRYGNAHPSIVPYQTFRGSDRTFAVGAGTDRHFRALCESVLGDKTLADDERFATNVLRVANRELLVDNLQERFITKTARTWVARCRKAGIPASLVQGVREALRSDAGRALVEQIEHPTIGTYDAVRNPLLFDGAPLPIGSAPPALGQHNAKILRELGYSRREIAAMSVPHD
jgi:crotonobetainyl-CoA:carnitine CoA-transferase CaiB-like acyl-CoA transferase